MDEETNSVWAQILPYKSFHESYYAHSIIYIKILPLWMNHVLTLHALNTQNHRKMLRHTVFATLRSERTPTIIFFIMF